MSCTLSERIKERRLLLGYNQPELAAIMNVSKQIVSNWENGNGIKILYEDLGKNINGFFQAAPRNKIIHINIRLDEHSKYFTCSHELGHALFHNKLNILFLEKNTFIIKNKLENEADYFSANLAIDNEDLKLDNFEGMTIDQIAAELHVPIELLKLRLKYIGQISN